MKRLPFMFALLSLGACAEDYPLPCTYAPSAPPGEMSTHPQCAARRDGKLVLSPEHLQRLSYQEGVASVAIEGEWCYVKRSGELLQVVAYDNGPDYFAEGLVRSPVDGKIAYYDAAFRQVLPPTYDWAWPFEGGRALVCKGCRLGEPDVEGHTSLEGGLWGYIDPSGKEVVPVTYTRETVP